jgi:two-component system, OmpR family, sensor histidine kinase VicK
LSNAAEEGSINGHRVSRMNTNNPDGETGAFLPEENYDAKAATSASDHEEKTEVIYGEDNVVRRSLQILPTVTRTLDLCGDRSGPSILLLNEQIKQMCLDLDDRGVRQRYITEITKENIIHCKELMKFQELRHLDGLKGFLSIVDGRMLTSHAYGQEGKTLSHMVVSNVRVFVEQQ